MVISTAHANQLYRLLSTNQILAKKIIFTTTHCQVSYTTLFHMLTTNWATNAASSSGYSPASSFFDFPSNGSCLTHAGHLQTLASFSNPSKSSSELSRLEPPGLLLRLEAAGGNVAFTSHPARGPLQGNPLAKDLLACMHLPRTSLSSSDGQLYLRKVPSRPYPHHLLVGSPALLLAAQISLTAARIDLFFHQPSLIAHVTWTSSRHFCFFFLASNTCMLQTSSSGSFGKI